MNVWPGRALTTNRNHHCTRSSVCLDDGVVCCSAIRLTVTDAQTTDSGYYHCRLNESYGLGGDYVDGTAVDVYCK